MVARDFAVLHGLTVGSMKQVLKHLKGQALAKGLYKRVFFHLPVVRPRAQREAVPRHGNTDLLQIQPHLRVPTLNPLLKHGTRKCGT